MPSHKHTWYCAGLVKHPRMGWPVDFYLCAEVHWAVDLKCYSVAIGDGESGNSKPGKEFNSFNDMYFWLGSP